MMKNKFKYRMNYTIFVLISFLFTSSCKKGENSIEKENIENLKKIKLNLDKSVLHIKNKYLNSEYSKSHNLFNIIPSDSNWVRNDIYYDKVLGNLLKDTNIRYISLRNIESCNNFESISQLFFVINQKSERQYYFVYNFCDFKHEIDESLNYKIIPFNEKWSLEIEKN